MQEMDRVKGILSASPAVIYTCRPSGDFGATFISENIKDQLGYSPKDFTENACFWADNIYPDDKEKVYAGLEKLFTNNTHTHEYRFRRSDGVYVWMRDELRLLRDSKGQPLEIVGSWLNITDRKEMEQKLQRSLDHKRDFISTAAHEFRTPLTIIIGYLELLNNDESFTEEEKKGFLSIAFEKCLYLDGMFDDLLDVSRLESGQLIAINKINIDVLDYFSNNFNSLENDFTTHDFSFDIQAQGCKANLDDGKIRRVVTNIVSNAVKYSNDGGGGYESL
jgi:PAS domain S-box-containing protein